MVVRVRLDCSELLLPPTLRKSGLILIIVLLSCGGLALDLGQDLSHNEQDIPHSA